jgi:hypothetical protein
MSQETFELYQVKDGNETRDFRFEPLEQLKAAGRAVERGNYEQVCAGTFERGNATATEMLSALFEQFNTALPQGYQGRAMSVSDIVVLRNEENAAAYYVDHFGFEEVPEFLAETQNRAADPPRYYPINERAARNAKHANSFSDYVPGSATAEYRAMVDKAVELGEAQKERVDPMYHEKIDRLVDVYARKLADNLNERSNIEARVPSIMIAGGGNFPVRKKEKQNMARDRNMGEYEEVKGILEKIRSTGMGGISADDDLAVEKLESKLQGLQEAQEAMKAVNAYYRKYKTLDGCPYYSEDEKAKIQSSMSRDWRTDPVPFPSYALTNNGANIRRIQQRIEDLKNKSEYAGWTFEGGKAEINETENRLQLFFDEKPTDEQRAALKRNGFKWSPTQGAWQRQLTKNAIHSAGYMDFIKPTEGKTPYQLQPFAHKKARDEHGL